MAGLPRSAVSFRRQGSSGLVWDDDKLLAAELNRKEGGAQSDNPELRFGVDQLEVQCSAPRASLIERSQSVGGGRGFQTGRVSAAADPPSPKVSACGLFCDFRKQEKSRLRSNSYTVKLFS